MTTRPKVDTILVTIARELPASCLDQLRTVARQVHCYPANDPPASVLATATVLFCSIRGLPASVTSLSQQMPKLRLIQLVSAGVDQLLTSPAFDQVDDPVRRGIMVANSSGTHVPTIPPYVFATVVMLYMRLHTQYLNAATRAAWIDDLPNPDGSPYFARSVRGRTVGLLGYGSLGRETARLFGAAGARIIAANTTGQRTKDDGYVIPGTGDVECLLPEHVYSTADEDDMASFLSRCDILVASLPSTAKTRYMLEDRHFRLLPRDAVFVNVGRGDVARSSVLLAALERHADDGNGPLLGLVADVTDPEPLPAGHPLYTHPNAIITPHLSGTAGDEEYRIATDICRVNVKRLAEGKPCLNLVDVSMGY
ncbi:uncharacterized protein PFL1_03315 [Pseudozyma flocculosa PF-1]|uniref:D-isomer specific 2-hydroxyacid dehydrogenase NAD-binding domain-containing protein n=2 Tax=Pseudozyma flocculosa TaxID=84751 RepID=A0A5C3F9H0_9BASI|nr:uncharacterized protein PFL1_03315 [Pseudozyma flocculosa PF-1]EPQ29025.1 hypothetical protein PFL1_03315 [Pseudozyma flocculosa PF-1]SPO40019.1 uncharacterized protein PSFLO_05501 [Pseudozyma flocculosa]